METEEIHTLIEKFRRAAIEKGDFAKVKKDHQLYEIMRNAYHELDNLGQAGKNALENLMDDESIFVRSWIAGALINEGNKKARKVLEEISRMPGITGFNAEMTLREFDKGNLKIAFPK